LINAADQRGLSMVKRPSSTKRLHGDSKARSGPSAWPSIEKQLVASKIIRGSALEKLIKDNQEFHKLRPDEAHDRLGIPPWLRVYWRKHHPEGNYSAANPSGGYPRLLRRVHEWMLMHQDLQPGKHLGHSLHDAGVGHGQ
jgi:hypothetical protein